MKYIKPKYNPTTFALLGPNICIEIIMQNNEVLVSGYAYLILNIFQRIEC